MIDITNWEYVYKFHNGYYETTNLLYTPRMNPQGTILCMDWKNTGVYQTNKKLTEELINFFFEQEIRYLNTFKEYKWCPNIIAIEGRSIFIEWNKESLNAIIKSESTLTDILPNWRDQLLEILRDINNAGYYKMTLYPHCFYIDQNMQLKSFDFYACIEKAHPYIERFKIEGMIGTESINFFNDATINGVIDFNIFFKSTLISRLSNTWPENPFPQLYDQLCTK